MLPIARIYASVLVLLLLVNNTSSFASSAKAVSSGKLDDGGAAGLSFTTGVTTGAEQPLGDILILDHLNINHEQGRHDWLKAFYF
jgi:hypothetical protein